MITPARPFRCSAKRPGALTDGLLVWASTMANCYERSLLPSQGSRFGWIEDRFLQRGGTGHLERVLRSSGQSCGVSARPWDRKRPSQRDMDAELARIPGAVLRHRDGRHRDRADQHAVEPG